MNEGVWIRPPRNLRIVIVMTSEWRQKLSLALLVLALGGLAQPALAGALAAEACCPAMAGMPDAKKGHPEQAPVRCQWITPAACCDQAAATGAPPAFAPTPPVAYFQTAIPPNPGQHRMHAPVAAPTSQAVALATVVLRL